MSKRLKVLLLGGGGREHAIFNKISLSYLAESVQVFPGNGGFPESVLIKDPDFQYQEKTGFQKWIQAHNIDLVIVGPEEPLVAGIADWCSEVKVPCFGPSAFCAQIEGSKEFAKKLMKEAGIPTASYSSFKDFNTASEYCKTQSFPLVVKADGLAAGKGVSVCETLDLALEFLKGIFLDKKFGESGSSVVIESFLTGEEASLFVLTDGSHFKFFPAAQDHKRAFDGDLGPNTGGMGAYAPAPIVSKIVMQKIEERIVSPILKLFREKKHPYRGLLYVGLMIDSAGEPYVVEFNCRFGDPETQVVLSLLQEDLLELLYNCAKGELGNRPLKATDGFSAVVVAAAKGYPDKPEKGFELTLTLPPKPVQVVHAGTQSKEGKLLASGGRVLGVTSVRPNLALALKDIYDYLALNENPKLFYRKDIGKRAL